MSALLPEIPAVEPNGVAIRDDVAAQAIHVDREFAGLIPPLAQDELAKLEASLRGVGGCRDPLVVWAGHDFLLDGHNRYLICSKYNIPFRVTFVELPDREAARAWIIHNQMGKRNLTPEALSYLRGQRYLAEKKSHGGDRTGATGHNVLLTTAARLADEFKVSDKTIQRDANFAEALDALAEVCGPEAKPWVLTRDARLTRGDVVRLATLEKAEQKRLFAQVRTAPERIWGLWSETSASKNKRKRLLLPRQTKPLAAALVEKLGQAKIQQLLRALTALLGQEAQTGETPKPQRRKPR